MRWIMIIKRILQVNEFNNKKENRKGYIYFVELTTADDKDNFVLKCITSFRLTEGEEIRIPFLLTDYLKYAVKINLADTNI